MNEAAENSAGDHLPKFEENVLPHVRALLRTAMRVSRDRYKAEDLVQETVLCAWKAFRNSHEVQNYKAWLFAIMLHQWGRECRRPVCDPLTDADGNISVISRRGPRTATAEESVLLREILEQIDSLPMEQRTVLLMAVVEEVPLKEIARILDLPIGTVFSRLGRARANLRNQFMSRLDGSPVQADQARK